MDLSYLCRQAMIGKITYSHDGASFGDGLHPDDPSVAASEEWRGKPVLLLVRDPRDVLVSSYHHAKYRHGRYQGSLSEFIRMPENGIDKILISLNRWNESKGNARSFTVMTYEDMHGDARTCLREVVKMIGLAPDESAIGSAVEFSSFENMKKMESENTLKDVRLANFRGSAEGAKVRAGKVGAFREHFNDEDLLYINSRIDALGCPFGDYLSR